MRKALFVVIPLACALGSRSVAEPAPAGGTIAIVEWQAPDPGLLERLGDSFALLAYSGDLAVVLAPPGAAIPDAFAGILTLLEPLDAAGDYYLFHVADAGRASFAGDARVLARRGGTVLLRSAEGAPRLTAESEASLPGIAQPLLISLVPAAPPSVRDRKLARDDPPVIEFDPLVAPMVAAVDQTAYTNVWQALDDFETRYAYTPENRAAAAWMADLFLTYGLEVETQVYARNPDRANVIGILPGILDPGAVVYVGAHFDSISPTAATLAPGADDNASGTAAVLEAARVLSGHSFAYTIKFAAFNEEEQGMVGSRNYCAKIAAEEERVIGCFNFDMIAYAGTDAAPPDLAIYTNSASIELAYVLAAACTAFVPDGVEPKVFEDAGATWSDHVSFWNRGYKAITGIEDGGAWSDFCPWYHTVEDTIEKYPKDYPTHVTAAIVAALAHVAVPLSPDDCDGDGIPDAVELASGTAADCNANGIPDDCDIAAAASLDCNANGVPDECDIALGTSADADSNGIPDECEGYRRGDANADGAIDIADAVFVLGHLFAAGPAPSCRDAGDANDDGALDIADAVAILGHLFAASGPLPQPFGSCGVDLTADDLDCGSFPPCEEGTT